MDVLLNELLQQFRRGDTAPIEQFYKSVYPYTADFILTNDGTTHDARRCFRRALSLLFRQLNEHQLPQLTCSIETYIYTLTRNLWLMELNRRGKNPLNMNTSQPEAVLPTIPDYVLQTAPLPEPPTPAVADALDKLKPDYKKFLIAFYFYKLSLPEIADWMDYSDSFARVKKKRCLDELKRIMNGAPASEESEE